MMVRDGSLPSGSVGFASKDYGLEFRRPKMAPALRPPTEHSSTRLKPLTTRASDRLAVGRINGCNLRSR